MRQLQLTYMELDYAENTAAVVRFTQYDSKGRAACVRQYDYSDTPDGVQELQSAIELAVETRLDMTVLSCYSPDYFPVIHELMEDWPQKP